MILKIFYWKLFLCSPRSFLLVACVFGLIIISTNVRYNQLDHHHQGIREHESILVSPNSPLSSSSPLTNVASRETIYYHLPSATQTKPSTINSNGGLLLGDEFNPQEYVSSQTRFNVTHPMELHNFNQAASDSTGYDRVLWDMRNAMCKKMKKPVIEAPATGSSVSVVICFHNEARSALLRTVYSVLKKTPTALLREILLIDDYSSDRLDGELLQSIPNVKVIRLKSRQGLVRARLVGSKNAKGTILAFLDSHCEVTEGWLRPLVERVWMSRNTIASPIIDIIDKNTMKYVSAIMSIKGGFGHDLYFKWIKLSPEDIEKRRRDVTAPILTPAIAGGLFVVDKQFFIDLGMYDEQMDIWGGENVELSLRVWMCGGRLEILPCSHVGHIFRSTMPYGFGEGKSYFTTVLKNLRRTAELWLDSYKGLFYEEIPEAKKIDYGNLAARLALKKKLKCKSFDWYINNVYPEFRSNYTRSIYYQILQYSTGCISLATNGSVKTTSIDATSTTILPDVHIRACEFVVIGPSSNQAWVFTNAGQIRHTTGVCLAANDVDGMRNGPVHQSAIFLKLQKCSKNIDSAEYDQQLFTKSGKKNSVRIKHHRTQLCLESAVISKQLPQQYSLTLQPCTTNSSTTDQDWTLRTLT